MVSLGQHFEVEFVFEILRLETVNF